MTHDRIVSVLYTYKLVLGAHIPERGAKCWKCHCRWMIDEILLWGPNRPGKTNRWLGFLQGALWAHGLFTIDEMREQNREPDNPKHSEDLDDMPVPEPGANVEPEPVATTEPVTGSRTRNSNS